MKAVILAGISGSGKSTYLKETGLASVSTDVYVENFGKDEGLNYSDAFDKIQELHLFKDFQRLFYIDIEANIKGGVDFAIDRTNLTVGYRAKLIADLKELAEKYSQTLIIECISFDLPLPEIKERLKKREAETGKSIPEEVIDNQFKAYEKPTDEEDFDKLVALNA